MAHSCPECGSACYCGGDIDDLLFDDTEREAKCVCCLGKEQDDDDCEPEYYEEEPGYLRE